MIHIISLLRIPIVGANVSGSAHMIPFCYLPREYFVKKTEILNAN